MQKPEPLYAVTVEARLPEFETERLFVANEKRFAHEELAKIEGKHKLVKAALPLVGSPKPSDWKTYLHQLDRYWVQLNEHETEIEQGLVPLKFFVINTGPQLDAAIKIKIMVKKGTIHPAKRPPQRPPRVDNGPAHVTAWTPSRPVVPQPGGFLRSGIKITPHTIEAQFSQLEGNDSADLVHQILYIEGNDDTHFEYEITSKQLGETEHGQVIFT